MPVTAEGSNRMGRYLPMLLLLALAVHAGCVKKTPEADRVKEIPLKGPAARADAEISGLAWYGDRLILLPQYPERFGPGQGRLFTILREQIERNIKGSEPSPVKPAEIEFIAPGIAQSVPGYDGYEAIAFAGNRVYLAIESDTVSRGGFLVRGVISPDCTRILLEPERLVHVPGQSNVPNASYESLIVMGREVIAIHEACGRNVNASPVAHVFDLDLNYLRAIPFPHVEYRITDATPPDARGRFRVINYFWPGDLHDYSPGPGPHERASGVGPLSVEQLLLFRYTGKNVQLLKEPPVGFHCLSAGSDSCNWEGIVPLDDQGFILVTDRFPRTILGYIITE